MLTIITFIAYFEVIQATIQGICIIFVLCTGLMCAIEETSPGKERGFCRVRGTSELGAGNDVGAVEDAVEDAIGVNQ